MRQIGKGKGKNLRDDRFVWVEGEVSADKDYNAVAQMNPDKDIPDRIPEDGFYLKSTNANADAAQADRVGWYVAGAFKPNRIISDREAREIIDQWNADHPDDEKVEYDFPRESGKEFNAETMQLEEVRDDIAQYGTTQPNSGLFEYFKGTLMDLVKLGKKAGNKLYKMILIPEVSGRLINDLKQKGIVLDVPYKHTIDNFAIKHTFNEHASEEERLRGQIPVTEDDFSLATDVIENYDDIEVGDNPRGQHIILYKKAYNDGRIVYVEEIRGKKRGELAFVSMRKFKAKKSELPNEAENASTLGSPANSTDKDTEDSGTVQENDKKKYSLEDVEVPELSEGTRTYQDGRFEKYYSDNIKSVQEFYTKGDVEGLGAAVRGFANWVKKQQRTIKKDLKYWEDESHPYIRRDRMWLEIFEKVHELLFFRKKQYFCRMSKIRPLLFGLLMSVVGGINAQILCKEFVYEPKDFPSCHASTIACLQNGDLATAFFGGSYEGCPDVCIWVCRKAAGSDRWTEPVVAADGVLNDTLRKACYNPVLYQMPDGELWLFFKIGSCVADWTGWLTRSRDNGVTWSEKEALPNGFLGPIKNKPELIGNRLVCPSSTENDGWRIHFEIYDLVTHEWHKTPDIEAALAPSLIEPGRILPIGAIQPSIIRLADGTLQAICRTQNGRLATSYSHDNGESWSLMELTEMPNNCSGTDAVTIHPTLHALVYNPVESVLGDYRDPRTPLDIATSMDGIYWHKLVTLEHEPGSEFSYPAVVVDPRDSTLHITYTWKRQRIVYAHVKPYSE